ncbi:MAG: hypothetical protein KQH83_11335 [Actinobacteria bacterium]|nr:hypothetical protein [Actinomycetota bacterium]
MERIFATVPHWLAWPIGLLSTAAALGGSILVFWGAAFGDGGIEPFVWGAACFAGAGILWWLAELASSNRPL